MRKMTLYCNEAFLHLCKRSVRKALLISVLKLLNEELNAQ